MTKKELKTCHGFQNEYMIGKVIGTGGYSIVKIVKNKHTEEVFAAKIIKKYELNENQLRNIMFEAETL